MKRNPAITYLNVDGMQNCIAAIKDLVSGELSNCFIEMSACAGSCIGGPAMERRRCRCATTRSSTPTPGETILPSPSQCRTSWRNRTRRLHPCPAHRRGGDRRDAPQDGQNEARGRTQLRLLRIHTCREKAAAVCQGKAEISMCLPYPWKKAKSFSDIIIQNSPTGSSCSTSRLKSRTSTTPSARS